MTPRERSLYRAFDLFQGLPDRQMDRLFALLRQQVVGLVAGRDTTALRDFIPRWWESTD